MDITTNTTVCDIVYLHATFHQGDEVHFMDYSRGHQCVTNSVVAIALSKICAIKQWTTEHLDSILKAGDVLYQQVRPNIHLIMDYWNLRIFQLSVTFLIDILKFAIMGV